MCQVQKFFDDDVLITYNLIIIFINTNTWSASKVSMTAANKEEKKYYSRRGELSK